MDRIVGQEQEWKARTHCGLEGPPVLTQGVGEGRGGAGFPSPVAAGGQVSIVTHTSGCLPFLERFQAG